MLIMYDTFTSMNYSFDEAMLVQFVQDTAPQPDGVTIIKNSSDRMIVNPDLYYQKQDIDIKLTAILKWKGAVDTLDDLPMEDLEIGFTYTVRNPGGILSSAEYGWNGEIWEMIGPTLDLSGYATKIYVQEISAELNGKITDLTTVVTNNKTTTDAAIVAEREAREAADGDINTSITTEATARSNADITLGNRIDTLSNTVSTNKTATDKAVQDESSARTTADNALQQSIDNHADDVVKHITADERTAWNAKATTAQVETAKTAAINTASADATSKANTAKTEAIATAASDASNKADAAQTAAITEANRVTKEHTDNTDVHVTTGDKAAWNAKATTGNVATAKDEAIAAAASDATSKANAALSSANQTTEAHANNNDVHVTTDDKNNWNAKATSADVNAAKNAAISAAADDATTKANTVNSKVDNVAYDLYEHSGSDDAHKELFNQKSDVDHGHNVSDVNGLQSSLDSKASGTALASEITNRTNADTALGNRITSEVAAAKTEAINSAASTADSKIATALLDYYDRDAINGLVAGTFKFQGKVETYEELLAQEAVNGHVWQVDDKEYACNELGEWIELGFNIDLSEYAKGDDVTAAIADALLEAKGYTDAQIQSHDADNEAHTGLFEQKADKSTVETLTGTVTDHATDTNIHVSPGDRDSWDAKATEGDVLTAKEEAIAASIADADEKLADKENVGVASTLVNEHATNDDAHLPLFRNKSDKGHKHSISDITDIDSMKDIVSVADLELGNPTTTTAWFNALASKKLSKDSLVFGAIRVSDLPENLNNAEIFIYVLQGTYTCYYAYLQSTTSDSIYYLNAGNSSGVFTDLSWRKIIDSSDLAAAVQTINTAIGLKASAEDLEEHVSDLDQHVTATDKTKWDNHTTSSSSHVSTDDRTNWNAKATTAQVNTAKSEAITAAATDATSKANTAKAAAIEEANEFTNEHINDSSVHVTSTEKASWDSKATTASVNTAKSEAIAAASTDASSKATTAKEEAISASSTALQEHTGDETIHVSETEKAAWNAKASTTNVSTAKSEAISAAATDATAKANAATEAAATALGSHTDDTVSHMSEDDRNVFAKLQSMLFPEWYTVEVSPEPDENEAPPSSFMLVPPVDDYKPYLKTYLTSIDWQNVHATDIPVCSAIRPFYKWQFSVDISDEAVTEFNFIVGNMTFTIEKDPPAGWPTVMLTFYWDGVTTRIKYETCIDHVVNFVAPVV